MTTTEQITPINWNVLVDGKLAGAFEWVDDACSDPRYVAWQGGHQEEPGDFAACMRWVETMHLAEQAFESGGSVVLVDAARLRALEAVYLAAWMALHDSDPHADLSVWVVDPLREAVKKLSDIEEATTPAPNAGEGQEAA